MITAAVSHSSEPTTVPPDFEAQCDEVIAHYPVSKRSASLPLLHLWQERFGYVSSFGMEWIASKLELEPIHIYELVTFYPMIRQQPVGKYHIKVCRTLSCMLGGARETFERFKELTGAVGDEHGPLHSPCGTYTIEWSECLASCGTAPVVMVGEDFYEKVDGAKVQELVKKYQ